MNFPIVLVGISFSPKPSKYLTILDEHSFSFDLKGYETNEANFFRFGGNFHDTLITNEKMKLFLRENENIITPLTAQYIKKLKK